MKFIAIYEFNLSGDGRLNLILGGIGEILSCPLTLICFKFFGRRTLMSITLLVAGISCILFTLVGNFVADESKHTVLFTCRNCIF